RAAGVAYNSACSRTRASRARCSAAHAGAARSADATRAATRSVGNHTGKHAERPASGLGEENIGVSDGQVVTGDGYVKVVCQRNPDGIVIRQQWLAILNGLLDPGRIVERRRWNFGGNKAGKWVGKQRRGLGIVYVGRRRQRLGLGCIDRGRARL